MSKGLIPLILGVAALAGGSMWASTSGLGITRPNKDPVSVREQSARRAYFAGGSHRHGK